MFARCVVASASVRQCCKVGGGKAAVLLGKAHNLPLCTATISFAAPVRKSNGSFCDVACRFTAQAQCLGRLPVRVTLSQ